MVELDFYYNQHNQASAVTKTAMQVDARVKGGLMVLCEFAGNEFNPEETRRCKYYDKSRQRTCCMYYHPEINDGVGDCIKEDK